MSDPEKVELFTDGACLGNPGPGGWAALLRFNGNEREISGGVLKTTNNRMEMMAVIEGLKALKRPCRVCVTSDSQYVIRGVTEWLKGWKARNWKTAYKEPVKNVDLWQALDEARAPHEVTWQWVRGHDGHPENERVDVLSRSEAEKIKSSGE
jgi:ribonuclease HI